MIGNIQAGICFPSFLLLQVRRENFIMLIWSFAKVNGREKSIFDLYAKVYVREMSKLWDFLNLRKFLVGGHLKSTFVEEGRGSHWKANKNEQGKGEGVVACLYVPFFNKNTEIFKMKFYSYSPAFPKIFDFKFTFADFVYTVESISKADIYKADAV